MSDDGADGITLIGFVGSVFSPYYAWARRRGPAEPENHCALNVALYGAQGGRWAMTERGRAAVSRSATRLKIGPSAMAWDGSALVIRIDEITAPWPSRLHGTVRVRPLVENSRVFALDAAGRHRWQPIAPLARVEVTLDRPARRWSGTGYFDTNDGDAPLEADFSRWDWCRAAHPDGATVLYNTFRRDGGTAALALSFAAGRDVEERDPPPVAMLPATRWGVGRQTRADAGHAARVARTLTDAPFYARSVVETRLFGRDVTALHESLSLDRFRKPWVQMMLPFRMPRASGKG